MLHILFVIGVLAIIAAVDSGLIESLSLFSEIRGQCAAIEDIEEIKNAVRPKFPPPPPPPPEKRAM